MSTLRDEMLDIHYQMLPEEETVDRTIALIEARLTSDEAITAAVDQTFSAEWAEGEDIPALRRGRIAEYRAGITAALDAMSGKIRV